MSAVRAVERRFGEVGGEFLPFRGQRPRVGVSELPADEGRPVRPHRPGAGLVLQQAEVAARRAAVSLVLAVTLLGVGNAPQPVRRAGATARVRRDAGECPQPLERLHGLAALGQARRARRGRVVAFRIGGGGARHGEVPRPAGDGRHPWQQQVRQRAIGLKCPQRVDATGTPAERVVSGEKRQHETPRIWNRGKLCSQDRTTEPVPIPVGWRRSDRCDGVASAVGVRSRPVRTPPPAPSSV